jgi:hypothetical protein
VNEKGVACVYWVGGVLEQKQKARGRQKSNKFFPPRRRKYGPPRPIAGMVLVLFSREQHKAKEKKQAKKCW